MQIVIGVSSNVLGSPAYGVEAEGLDAGSGRLEKGMTRGISRRMNCFVVGIEERGFFNVIQAN